MHIRKEFISAIFFLLLFGFNISSAFAASIVIQNAKTELTDINEEFPVDVNLSINTNTGTQYYLRGVFYKEGTSNYCGYTWNGAEWFSGPYSSNEGWKNFLPLTVTNNSWSGQLKAKINSEDSTCNAPGVYKFKIQRFTSSGSSAFDSQTDEAVSFVFSSPTPTPTPTVKPSNTPTPTSTPKPTNTPTPTRTPTPTKTPTPIKTPTPTKAPSLTLTPSSPAKAGSSGQALTPTNIQAINSSKNEDIASSGAQSTQEILGIETTDKHDEIIVPTDIPISEASQVKGIFESVLSPVLIVVGGVMLLATALFAYFKFRKTGFEDKMRDINY